METVLIVEDDRVYARTTTNWLVRNMSLIHISEPTRH